MLAVFPLTTARYRLWWSHCPSLGRLKCQQVSLRDSSLGSEISFSRTNNCPTDLISFTYRIASVTFEALYCLCVYMVVQLRAHKNKHLQSVLYLFLREHCPDGLWNIFGGSRVDFLFTQLYYILFDRVSDGGPWYSGLLQWIADSRYRKGWKTLLYANLLLQKKYLIWYELC